MKKELIVQLYASFEQLAHREEESGVEFWLARDLQEVLGYQTWRSFEQVVEKAVTACQNAGYNPSDHFAETSKMPPPGSGSEREVSDYMLTRYACYLIAQNGDSTKAPIAFANEITNFNIKREDLRMESSIAYEHIKNNAEVRKLLGKRGIVPEQLPPSEDIKKIERRVESEQKKLPKQMKSLESDNQE